MNYLITTKRWLRRGVAAAVLANTLVQAQTPKTPPPAVLPAPANNPAAPSQGPNKITQAAVQQGVLACASRINQVTNFLGFSDQVGATLLVPPGQADQRLLTVVMETPVEGSAAYATATFAPNQANGCGATYDAVEYWPLACDVVAAKRFPSMAKVGLLKKAITVLDGGVATKVFLMTAGAGCISIKKEIVL